MADEKLRLFYTEYTGKTVLALEFAGDVDANIYRELLSNCCVKILAAYYQSKINGLVTYPITHNIIDKELFTQIFILEGNSSSINIQYLMWELEKRCQLEHEFRLPAYKKTIRKRKRKNETSNNN